MPGRDASEAPEGFRRGPLLDFSRTELGRIQEKRSIHGVYVRREITLLASMLVQVTEGGERRGHCVVFLLTGDGVTLESCPSGASFSFAARVSLLFLVFFSLMPVRSLRLYASVSSHAEEVGVAICATLACGALRGCKSLVPHRSCKLVALEARNAVGESGLSCICGPGNGICYI